MKQENQSTNKSNNQPTNQSINNSDSCQSTTNPNFSTSFQQIQAFRKAFSNVITLFHGSSQISGKFLVVLFHSFIGSEIKYFFYQFQHSSCKFYSSFYQVFKLNTVFTIKSTIYFNNFSILVASIIQIYRFSAPCYFIHSQGNITLLFNN